MPTYDAWGDDFSEDDYAPAAAETTEPEPQNPASDLVLLIDKLRANDSDDDTDEEPEQDEQEEHDDSRARHGYEHEAKSVTEATPKESETQEAPTNKQDNARERAKCPLIDVAAASFAPPTPTFSLFPQTPETPQSDRSFASDTDSIQREPDHLNVGSRSLAEIQEEQGVKLMLEPEEGAEVAAAERERSDQSERVPTHAEEAENSGADKQVHPQSEPVESLVLSTDRMNLDSSDDSDHFSFGDNDDDWGYNSQHSSNDEVVEMPDEHSDDKEDEEQDDKDGLEYDYKPPHSHSSEAKHHIKTDALDSLISDLLKMERRLDISDHDSYGRHAPLAADSSVGELPSLDSIHDLSLPDFHDLSFDDLYSRVPKNMLPKVLELSTSLVSDDFRVQHEQFMNNVLSRKTSIRKPPLPHIPGKVDDHSDLGHLDGHLEADSDTQEPSDTDNREDSDASTISTGKQQLAPIVSTGSLSTGKMSFEDASVHPPPAVDDVSRRDSTMSHLTLAFGNWKPNTGMFRDKFVTDNDTESHMNMSIFNNDANYSKFTGLKDNGDTRSMVSVPETVDAYMPSIRESASDDDETPVLENPSLSSEKFSTTSVLKDRDYKPIFDEAETSLEQLPEHTSLGPKEFDTASTSSTSGGPAVAEKESIPAITKPLLHPYPVFNWKKIMSISQPVDRIAALRTAKADEVAYDTGLNYWLTETLKLSEVSTNMQIGKIASQAYQNAQHSDIRRHTSIRSRVSLVKDKMETGGLQASSLGRKFLSRGKKLMKSSD